MPLKPYPPYYRPIKHTATSIIPSPVPAHLQSSFSPAPAAALLGHSFPPISEPPPPFGTQPVDCGCANAVPVVIKVGVGSMLRVPEPVSAVGGLL